MARSELLERLPWDSEHFGFGVARWCGSTPTLESLAVARQSAKRMGASLIYVPLSETAPGGREVLESAGAVQVDLKTNYGKFLPAGDPEPPILDPTLPYGRAVVSHDLLMLAYASGEHSRFRMDARFPRAAFETLYRIWIEKSVSGEQADVVLVCRESGRETGMVTVKEEGAVARIGLIAVREDCRGHGLGGALLRGAEAWARQRGISSMEVMTQGHNAAACALYEAAHYRRLQAAPLFHWWI